VVGEKGREGREREREKDRNIAKNIRDLDPVLLSADLPRYLRLRTAAKQTRSPRPFPDICRRDYPCFLSPIVDSRCDDLPRPLKRAALDRWAIKRRWNMDIEQIEKFEIAPPSPRDCCLSSREAWSAAEYIAIRESRLYRENEVFLLTLDNLRTRRRRSRIESCSRTRVLRDKKIHLNEKER